MRVAPLQSNRSLFAMYVDMYTYVRTRAYEYVDAHEVV